MGRDIVRAIYHYANLDESPLSLPSTQRPPSFENGIIDRPSVSTATSTRSSFGDEDLLCHGSNHSGTSVEILKMEGGSLVDDGGGFDTSTGLRVTEANSDFLVQPLLKSTVYSLDAIASAYRDHPLKMKDDQRLIRLKCEISIRRALRMDCPACVTDSVNEIQLPPEEEPDPVGEGDDGSDSDPRSVTHTHPLNPSIPFNTHQYPSLHSITTHYNTTQHKTTHLTIPLNTPYQHTLSTPY